MTKKGKGKGHKNSAHASKPTGKMENQFFNGLLSDAELLSMSDEETLSAFSLMYELASMGYTPEDYAQFYAVFQATSSLLSGTPQSEGSHGFVNPFTGVKAGNRSETVKEYVPLKDAAEHTLVLKIQMKDVVKPPMWREVEVPANFNFMQLHEIIQEVCGFDDSHLWQFNKKAYDDSLLIGFEDEGTGFEKVTHDAEETPLTMFLQKKGDKLEYVYDFGDDWIFTIEVKDLLDKKSDHPVCRKYKSELNAIEDMGGTWSYIDLRKDLEEWTDLSKKARKQHASQYEFDSEEDYLMFLKEHCLSLDDVNEHFSKM